MEADTPTTVASTLEVFSAPARTGLSWDDVIVVTYAPGKTPPHQLPKYASKLKREFKKSFPGNKIVVVPDTVTVHILK